MSHSIQPGVITGKQVQEVFQLAKDKKFALPAVNVIGSSSINGVLETAASLNAPVIVQFSNGGAQFNAGKGLSNENQQAAIAGAVAGAKHVHQLAEAYGAVVILHTDHAAKKLLPWIDGLLDASEKHFEETGKSLFSSHMIDLSEEPLEENIAICKEYLKRMSKMDMTLEIELGVTGGEEDGVDNTDIDSSKLYTQPEEVAYAFEVQSDDTFPVADLFGNFDIIDTNSGSTTTGISGVELDLSTGATTTTLPLKAIDISQDPDNSDVSTSNTNVMVVIQNHISGVKGAGLA